MPVVIENTCCVSYFWRYTTEAGCHPANQEIKFPSSFMLSCSDFLYLIPPSYSWMPLICYRTEVNFTIRSHKPSPAHHWPLSSPQTVYQAVLPIVGFHSSGPLLSACWDATQNKKSGIFLKLVPINLLLPLWRSKAKNVISEYLVIKCKFFTRCSFRSHSKIPFYNTMKPTISFVCSLIIFHVTGSKALNGKSVPLQARGAQRVPGS